MSLMVNKIDHDRLHNKERSRERYSMHVYTCAVERSRYCETTVTIPRRRTVD